MILNWQTSKSYGYTEWKTSHPATTQDLLHAWGPWGQEVAGWCWMKVRKLYHLMFLARLLLWTSKIYTWSQSTKTARVHLVLPRHCLLRLRRRHVKYGDTERSWTYLMNCLKTINPYQSTTTYYVGSCLVASTVPNTTSWLCPLTLMELEISEVSYFGRFGRLQASLSSFTRCTEIPSFTSS